MFQVVRILPHTLWPRVSLKKKTHTLQYYSWWKKELKHGQDLTIRVVNKSFPPLNILYSGLKKIQPILNLIADRIWARFPCWKSDGTIYSRGGGGSGLLNNVNNNWFTPSSSQVRVNPLAAGFLSINVCVVLKFYSQHEMLFRHRTKNNGATHAI